jgi:hypothetical protein
MAARDCDQLELAQACKPTPTSFPAIESVLLKRKQNLLRVCQRSDTGICCVSHVHAQQSQQDSTNVRQLRLQELRHWRQRRNTAAVTIQAAVRGYLCRQGLAEARRSCITRAAVQQAVLAWCFTGWCDRVRARSRRSQHLDRHGTRAHRHLPAKFCGRQVCAQRCELTRWQRMPSSDIWTTFHPHGDRRCKRVGVMHTQLHGAAGGEKPCAGWLGHDWCCADHATTILLKKLGCLEIVTCAHGAVMKVQPWYPPPQGAAPCCRQGAITAVASAADASSRSSKSACNT